MEKKQIKGQKLKGEARVKPKTEVQLKKENLGFEMQINELKNKISENRRKLLEFESTPKERTGFFSDCDFKDFPDK
jgi:ribosomal 50S subunit-recycling heat shock protein